MREGQEKWVRVMTYQVGYTPKQPLSIPSQAEHSFLLASEQISRHRNEILCKGRLPKTIQTMMFAVLFVGIGLNSCLSKHKYQLL